MQPEFKGQWLILLTEWDSVLSDPKGEGDYYRYHLCFTPLDSIGQQRWQRVSRSHEVRLFFLGTWLKVTQSTGKEEGKNVAKETDPPQKDTGRIRLKNTFTHESHSNSFSKTIQLSNKVKVSWTKIRLGGRLRRSSWIRQWTRPTYSYIWTCRCTLWKMYGLRPKVLHYEYTMVAKPTITCAATGGG